MSVADIDQGEGPRFTDETPTLFDLTARLWRLAASVSALAVDGHALAVAFSLGDGTIALACASDPEPSENRVRLAGDSGQRLLLPRSASFAPPVVVSTGDSAPKPLAPTATGFVTADAAGRLIRLSPRGETRPLAVALDGRVVAITADERSGAVAVAAEREVVVLTPNGQPLFRLSLAGARVLGLSPGGDRLAVGGADGLKLVDIASGERAHVGCPAPQVLEWSPDGDVVALGHEMPGLTLVDVRARTCHTVANYPRPVRSLAFGGHSRALATSGAFRAVAWSMAALPFGGDGQGAFLAGRAESSPVEAVALHPRRPILAAGRADGSIALAEVGSYSELKLAGPGGEAVSALAFFGERDDLAIGFAGGSIAIASLPAIMFKC